MDTCENGHTYQSHMTLAYDPIARLKAAMKLGGEKVEVPVQETTEQAPFSSMTFAVLPGGKVAYLGKNLPEFDYRYDDAEDRAEDPDKFTTPEPLPTAYENELLDCLIEECAEVIQRATKMKRFGVFEIQDGQSLSNCDRLSEELGDLQAVVERCAEVGLIDLMVVGGQVPIKHAKLDKYLQHEPEAA
jgi:NTP pyrophosphatase (non-canonical NTP hydrolase)